MFRTRDNLTLINSRNMMIWCVLAFQGGAINAGGFLACHRFVTHITGFATYFGAEAAKGNFLAALGMLSVPIFFLAGTMVSAFFVDRRLGLGLEPRYPFVMFLIFLNMLIVLITAELGVFGKFGESLSLYRDYTLLAFLCLSSGIQNAVVSSASGAVVRTTHLTGITTDLGIGLVRVLSYKKNSAEYDKERSFNSMRIGCILSFLLGSTFATLVFVHVSYWGFIVPTLTSLYIFAIVSSLQKKSLHNKDQYNQKVG